MGVSVPDVPIGTPTQQFLHLARERLRQVIAAESKTRSKMKQDFDFKNVDQWDPVDRANREQDGRPCLTINRIPQFIKQVTNAQRTMRLGVQVNPVDSKADPKVAMVLQGVFRNIETTSDADIAYDTAFEHCATAGRGFWRIYTEYSDDDNFEQNIVIDAIPDSFSVYQDPTGRKWDGSDTRYCFLVSDMPKDEFVKQYGADANSEFESWLTTHGGADWAPEGKRRVAEYFYRDDDEKEIVQMRITNWAGHPQTIKMDSEELEKIKKENREAGLPELNPSWKELDRRKVVVPIVKWAKITPTRVLEGNDELTGGIEFPCKYIPVVRVLGDMTVTNGEMDIRGMVRDAKDPARMISFWASALTEMIGIAPRAPYIGFAGQFKGHENKWNNANRRNFAYLEVEPITVGGQIAPPPTRTQFTPDIQALIEAFMLADNDLKAVMGIYDASLGKSGPEQSGKAILARQKQSEMGNNNYLDNMGRAIRFSGKIILDMLPRILTPARIMRILAADNVETRTVMIHNGGADQEKLKEMAETVEGIEGIYDVSVGRYDITISSGPSYASKRQEAVASILQLIQAQPEIAPIVADKLVENMDWPGAPEIAQRLERMVPPQAKGEADPNAGLPPEVKKMIDDLQQEVAELRAGVQVKQMEIESKAKIAQAEIIVKERMAQLTAASKLQEQQVRLSAERSEVMIKAELDKLLQKMDQSFEERMKRLELETEERIATERIESEERQNRERLDAEEEIATSENEVALEVAETDAATKKSIAAADRKAAAAAEAAKPKPKKKD